MTVWQESIQKSWDDYNVRIVEMSIVASFIAFVITLIYSVFTKELIEWKPAIDASTKTKEGLVLVSSVSILLPILKLIVRSSKYSTIQYSNAFFFEFIQSSAALLTSVSSIIIFGEPWGPVYIAAFFLLAISFGFYAKAKLVEKEKKEKKEKMAIPSVKEMYVINPITHPEAKIEVTVTWK
jgi:ABC-type protease/lipase transport system fused ATPase/permease subunit